MTFQVTDKQRNDVAVMAAGGMTREKIAAAIGISGPTLDKYFEMEMTTAAAQIRCRIIAKLLDKADEGSVPAIKAFLALDPSGAPATQDEGVKAERQRAAVTADKGSVWEDAKH